MEESATKAKAQYRVLVQTANAYVGAGGKDNLVILEMTGKDGTVTGPIQLNKLGDPNFRRGEVDIFHVDAIDVGLPVLIRLELREHKGKNPWGVKRVKITYKGEKARFPVHDWVESELNIPTGEALLHHRVDNPHVLSILKREVDFTRVLLPWVRRPGPADATRSLPRYVDASIKSEIPLIFQPTEKWTQSFGQNSVEVGIMKATLFLQKHKFQLKGLADYHMLYQVFENGAEKSEFLTRWQSDEEFGRQQLNGIAPTSLERCAKIPESCQINGDHVKGVLEGTTLDVEMKKGRVYMVDFTRIFRDVNRNKNEQGQQLYCPDVICIFHVNSNDDLVPIAIQLVPGDTDTIFTPKDSPHDWLLAKMYYKVAFGCMHEWYYHFLLTHGVMESFAVAVFRDLPRSHPVYKLLRPHLQTVTVINLLARNLLILADSSANKALGLEGEDLARKMYETFDMNDLNIPQLLKKRGLDDEKSLPKFYYRDDATKLWDIIEDFVSQVLRFYYSDDQDISRDKFLQDLMEDIAIEGIGWEDEQNRKGLPYPLTTVCQLIQLCTSVIFTSSVQHSAVNFPQYSQYKYVPNNPAAMRLPPHKKGEATMERIMQSLPDTKMSLIMIAITNSLSTYAPDEIMLGNYPVKLFADKPPKRAIKKFQSALLEYEKNVKTRNGDIPYPYKWLLPEMIANSISI